MIQRSKDTIPSLEKKQAAITEKLKQLRKKERAKDAAIERERHTILGAALAAELLENDRLAEQLEPILNTRVTKAKDRKLLGLLPLSTDAPSAGR